MPLVHDQEFDDSVVPGVALAAGNFDLVPPNGPGVLRLGGIVDASNVHVLSRIVDAAVRQGRGLVLDLSGVSFIDVAGLGVLYDAAVRLGARGVSVRLVAAPAPVAKVLEILGWHELASLEVEEALA